MYTNHDDRANHADQVGRDTAHAETRPIRCGSASTPAENRSQSRIASVYGQWLSSIARRLDWLRAVPRSLLGKAVAERGACMTTLPDGDPPTWLFDSGTDAQVAARLCAGCPVRDECLELELRLFGADTVGVWGALSEDDRRALYPHWVRHRDATGHFGPDDDTSSGSAGAQGGDQR